MSILNRLSAATDLNTLRQLAADFSNYRFASTNTRNKFHRRMANKSSNLKAAA